MTLLERIRSWAESRQFAANVAKISAGSIARTVISLLALPVATRLYAPDTFGALQVFASIVSVFVAIGPLKYEAAIALPEDEAESNHLAVLSVALSALIAVLVFGVISLLGTRVLAFMNAEQLEDYKLLIPVGIWLAMMFAITRHTLVAKKHFGTLSTTSVAHVAYAQSVTIGVGWFHPVVLGLILGRLAGNTLGVALALRRAPVRFSATSLASIRRVAAKYRKFPLVNTVGVFANTVATEAPVFLLAKFFGAESVGFYMMTTNILSQPLALVGESVGRVFLRYGAEARSRSAIELLGLFRSTVRNLALMALVPLLGVALLAPWGVPIVLGPEWEEAAVFMQILMLAKYLELVMVPVSTTFSIVNRQEVGVALMIGFGIVRIAAMVYFSGSTYSMLGALAVSSAAFSGIYILATDVVLRRLAAQETSPGPGAPRT